MQRIATLAFGLVAASATEIATAATAEVAATTTAEVAVEVATEVAAEVTAETEQYRGESRGYGQERRGYGQERSSYGGQRQAANVYESGDRFGSNSRFGTRSGHNGHGRDHNRATHYKQAPKQEECYGPHCDAPHQEECYGPHCDDCKDGSCGSQECYGPDCGCKDGSCAGPHQDSCADGKCGTEECYGPHCDAPHQEECYGPHCDAPHQDSCADGSCDAPHLGHAGHGSSSNYGYGFDRSIAGLRSDGYSIKPRQAASVALAAPVYAKCSIRDPEEESYLQGTIKFQQKPYGKTAIWGTIEGLKPGQHGFHVHSLGDMTGGCASLGGHWNPTGTTHTPVGDLIPAQADNYGRARIEQSDIDIDLWGTDSIIGRSLVIHKDANGGDRIGCCIIGLAAGPKPSRY